MAIITDEGLSLMSQWILGITVPDQMAVIVFNYPDVPDNTNVYADFQQTSLSGGSAILLDPTMWSDFSVAGTGDFVYPPLEWTFLTSVSGDTLVGYLVYAVTANVGLWFDVFPVPRVIPPTGGLQYVSLEWQGVNC